MTIWARADRPPTPMPCTTRQAMSMPAFCDRPAAAEPRTYMTRAIWTSAFLLYRSASLPHRGVAAVIDSRAAVTTQV